MNINIRYDTCSIYFVSFRNDGKMLFWNTRNVLDSVLGCH